jgi:hypothetical protein
MSTTSNLRTAMHELAPTPSKSDDSKSPDAQCPVDISHRYANGFSSASSLKDSLLQLPQGDERKTTSSKASDDQPTYGAGEYREMVPALWGSAYANRKYSGIDSKTEKAIDFLNRPAILQRKSSDLPC